MNSLIVQLLASEKLNGDNYAAWKSNLNTILVVDDLRFFLTEEFLQTPASNANRASRKAYDQMIKANKKARVYILASMSDVLAKKHESLATAKKIMDSLKGMFGQLEWSIRHEAIKYIYTKHMKKGISVREHVMDMMMHFNIVEVNGGTIDEANQVSFILESLPKSFIPFQTNASLNKIEFNLTTFLNELQRFQNLTKGKGKEVEANVATTKRKFKRGSSSKSKVGPLEPNHKILKKGKGKTPKHNKEKKTTVKGEITLKVRTGDMVSAKAVGDLKLFYNDRYIILKNVLIGRLVKNGLLSQLEDNSLPPCDSCLEGKMIKRSFTGKGLRTKISLELIHSDLCGPMNVKARGGYEYFISFIDDYSRYGHVYLIQNKFDSFEKFKEYNAEIENESDRPSSSTKVVDKTRNIGQTNPSQDLGEPRRSGRVVRQPDRYLGLSEAQIIIPDDGIEDPLSYKQAMNDVDYDEWIKAMDLEMESIFKMQNSKKGMLSYKYGIHLSKEKCPKTPQEVEDISNIPYASAVGSLMYAMLYARKSTSGSIFTLNGRVVVWRNIKQSCIADSTMEAEYVAACEAAKEAVWLKKFLIDLEVVPNMHLPITLYCDNSGAVANSREPRSHKRGKNIE
ncbi:gag/pol protein [Cucumis melo var. makuwa]|uniref:Gag/pol protein n=1 Tax=Cucumis melo var. makuwa TaxID=1194695 RepID=A0A5A7T2N1_CUCMM|nr:gag/pol protein [Cucumis melo var. makuwa]